MVMAVKSVIRRIPGVESAVAAHRTSRAAFERQLRDYLAAHAMTSPPAAGADPNLVSFLSDGAVLLPGYFPADKVAVVHDKLLPMLEQVRQGTAPSSWSTLDYGEDGIYRLHGVTELVPESRELVEDEYLLSLASGYLSGRLATPVAYVDYKPDLRHDHTSVLHMDTWRSQVKIFILLNEIGPGNAPLVYWLKSQRDGAWRRDFDYSFWSGSELGSHGHVPVTYLRRQREAGGPDAPQEMQFCGPRGSVVLADTRGIHRASNLREGYRLELAVKINEGAPGNG